MNRYDPVAVPAVLRQERAEFLDGGPGVGRMGVFILLHMASFRITSMTRKSCPRSLTPHALAADVAEALVLNTRSVLKV